MNKEQKNKSFRPKTVNNKEKKNHKILKAILKLFVVLIVLIIIFILSFVGYSIYKNGWGLKGLIQTAVGSNVKVEELEEFKVLILGVSEDISTKLTDTIMVASYNPQTQKAVLLSIPRDTYVGTSKINANSYDKINAIYQQGGAEATLEKVNKLTGLDIEYYVVISNNALVDLVDAIGGVEFDVPIDMDYDSSSQNLHIHLSAGRQTLTGEQAEWLVRFRKNNDGTSYSSEYGDNDYGRMKTQREFIKAVAKQTLSAKNITKIGDLIDVFKQNVSTNITDWNSVKDYIPYAVEFSTENIQTDTIPGESSRVPAGTGLWFFLADEKETQTLVKELFVDQSATLEDESLENTNTLTSNDKSTSSTSDKDIRIEILNGSGSSTKLTTMTKILKDKGYTIYKTGTTSTTSKTTIINKSNVSEDILSNIKDVIETGIISTSTSSSSNVDVTIIIGKDYN